MGKGYEVTSMEHNLILANEFSVHKEYRKRKLDNGLAN